MNNHTRGLRRDREIQRALSQSEYGCLDIFQLAELFFPSLKMAQKRMTRLYKAKKVGRFRENLGQPYIYYLDKRPEQYEHRLGMNWIRLWLVKTLPAWEEVCSFDYEINYGPLRPDGLMGVKNAVTGKCRFVFIEYDRGFNKFDKVTKYERWFDSGGYLGQWWAELVDRFPQVLVVSEKPPKVSSKLNFKVIYYDDILKEVKTCHTVSSCGNA